MQKVALEISNLSVKNMVIQILVVRRNQYAILFAATHVHMPKNDAASDTCQLFKGYSYKFPNQCRNWYFILFRDIAIRMQKLALEISNLFKIWSYKFLFLCRNWYKILLALTPCLYAKNDAASNTNQLFEGQSYKFRKVHRNQYKILSRLLEFVCQKMMLPATVNSCLKYIHTNFSIKVGTGT